MPAALALALQHREVIQTERAQAQKGTAGQAIAIALALALPILSGLLPRRGGSTPPVGVE